MLKYYSLKLKARTKKSCRFAAAAKSCEWLRIAISISSGLGNLGFLVTMSKWARKLNTDPPLLVLQTQFHKLQVLRRAMVPSRAIRFVAGHFRIDSSKQTLHQIFIAEKVQVSNIIDTIHSGVVKTRTGIIGICFICRTTDRFVHLRMLIPFKHLLGD